MTASITADAKKTSSKLKFKCFYCDIFPFSSDLERTKHIDAEHQGKLHYPTSDDFENRMKR